MPGIRRLFAAFSIAFLMTGCAQMAPPYSPDYASVDSLKRGSLAKVAVTTFQPTDPANPLNTINLRGSPMKAPSGSFAKYLEDAMVADLKELSVYDSSSKILIGATIKKNDVSVGSFTVGTGELAVDLNVTRNGVEALKKTYSSSIQFESSLLGGIAIPAGVNSYPSLVRAFLKQVYSDPEFVKAIGK